MFSPFNKCGCNIKSVLFWWSLDQCVCLPLTLLTVSLQKKLKIKVFTITSLSLSSLFCIQVGLTPPKNTILSILDCLQDAQRIKNISIKSMNITLSLCALTHGADRGIKHRTSRSNQVLQRYKGHQIQQSKQQLGYQTRTLSALRVLRH